MNSLKDKVIVITGAGSGIGLALARQCATAGASLALSDINAESLQNIADELRVKKINIHTEVVDVSNDSAVIEWAQNVAAHYKHVDVIINNAGIALSQSATTMTRTHWERVFNINFWGVVNGTSAFLPYLRKQPESHIVNISSVFGLVSMPTQAAYNASKFAVRGYTEALRQDLAGTGINITCIHPGGVKTNLVKTGEHFDGFDGAQTSTEEVSSLFEKIALTSPEKAASIIIQGILKNRRRVLVGMDAKILDWVQRLLPASYDQLLLPAIRWGTRYI
ncbi:MAG: SDR family NAD(P)-dependent oxidoreductase [Hahellaceae bacterium]|nr:SDR family NAD(P)-dependent oxidoreductase [Hahellaceae bacterium]MCP5212788.1 SDR family NAD(P)-dependent oxidoreductase [Hahellaceae bacterium]